MRGRRARDGGDEKGGREGEGQGMKMEDWEERRRAWAGEGRIGSENNITGRKTEKSVRHEKIRGTVEMMKKGGVVNRETGRESKDNIKGG